MRRPQHGRKVVGASQTLVQIEGLSSRGLQNARYHRLIVLVLFLLVEDTRKNEVLDVYWEGRGLADREAPLFFLDEVLQVALVFYMLLILLGQLIGLTWYDFCCYELIKRLFQVNYLLSWT